MAFWDGTRWIADAPSRRPPRRRGSRAADWIATLLMVALVPILVIATAGGALAAKPTSSVWVNELIVARGAALQFGDPFTVGYVSKEREPWALAQCFPNETTVFSSTYADGTVWGEIFSVYPGGPSPQGFVLGESIYPLWTAGGADCVVHLVTYSHNLSRRTIHASTWFTVTP